MTSSTDIRRISIVIPVFNEMGSLPMLRTELCAVMQQIAPIETEILLIDDGSTDGSQELLRQFAAEDARFRVFLFRRHQGQTPAMSCGIREATGEVIIPMDADLQNDPADIPALLTKVREGYSCVSGWRKERKDPFWNRRLPSTIANALISWMTGVRIHDYGCSLKAYRSDIIKGIELYGEMHRFIPAYAAWSGARVTEIVVNHRPRMHGVSKYGILRVFKVVLDLLVVKFLVRYFDRPIHFFGAIGLVAGALGIATFALMIGLKVAGARSFVETPLPVIGTLFVVLAVQFVLTGLLAEVMMRTYHASRGTAQDENAERVEATPASKL